VAAPVGYEIDRLIEPHPIFPLIQRHAQVDDSEMFEVFNMGLGFCYVVDPASAERTLRGAGDRHRRLRSAEDRAHRSPRACRAAQAILAGGWGGATRGVIGLQTLIPSSPRGAPRDA
jgi:hypothetical protein